AGLLLIAALLAAVRLLSPYRAGDAAKTEQHEYDCSDGSHDDLLSARCDATSGRKLSPITQERLSKQRRYEVVKKQKQLCSAANRSSGFAVQRHDGLCRDLPSHCDIREPAIP